MNSTAKSAAEKTTRLTKILTHLNAAPKLSLFGVKSLRLTLAFQNDHFGARHFVKEQLPRIRWANPDLDIHVEKVRKSEDEQWKPEMELEFTTGKQQSFNLQGKWSTAILKELMEVAGGNPWQKYKAEAKEEGRLVVPGEDSEVLNRQSLSFTHLPSLKQFRMSKPVKSETKQSSIPASPNPQEVTAP